MNFELQNEKKDDDSISLIYDRYQITIRYLFDLPKKTRPRKIFSSKGGGKG
jgi:hypothetical protein